MSTQTHCGFIAIVGQPNVGKSTLLNALVGKKLSITSNKPQTTRHQILGVKTLDSVQMIFVDTPGLHQQESRTLNRLMNQAARSSLEEVDLVLFVITALHWNDQDESVLQLLIQEKSNVILVINKVDMVRDRSRLLPFMDRLSQRHSFEHIIPISAKNGIQLSELQKLIIHYLPESPHFYEADQITDRSDSFIASEMVREKLTRHLGQELPYALTVAIEAIEQHEGILKIAAVIWVEKEGQKAIVIGKGGETLKRVGEEARLDMERYFEQKVFLKLWVKVKSNWADNEQLLNHLGYGE